MPATCSTDRLWSVASPVTPGMGQKGVTVKVEINISLRLDLGNLAAYESIINLVTAIILLIAAL